MDFKPLSMLLFLLIIFTMAGCTERREVLSTQELVSGAESYSGEEVSVLSVLRRGNTVCTEIACGEENPCCNTCSSELLLGNSSVRLVGGETEVGCRGNSCNVSCTPSEGSRYIFTGIFNRSEGVLRVDGYEVVRN